MATINPSQDYDVIHTLTYASSGGTDPIRLQGVTSGTVYYRAGTSGAWTTLAVSGSSTTFPITSTTMQIAHNWNKSGNNHMTPRFQNGTMTGIAISQKAVLSGGMGNSFMHSYAYNCSNLTTIAIPDTSGLTSVGNGFMHSYARGCTALTTLGIPDTSSLTSASGNFMAYYARDCSGLTQLTLPKAGWFKTNNVNWYVPAGRLNILKGSVLRYADLADWQALTVSGETLHTNYIQSVDDVYTDAEPEPPIQVWTGSDWKPGKFWDGSTWREDAKTWDGSQWV